MLPAWHFFIFILLQNNVLFSIMYLCKSPYDFYPFYTLLLIFSHPTFFRSHVIISLNITYLLHKGEHHYDGKKRDKPGTSSLSKVCNCIFRKGYRCKSLYPLLPWGRAAVRQQVGSAPQAYRYPDPGRIYHRILRLPPCARRQAGYHNG